MAEDTKDIEIKALPWNEHIRLRHGMYIGDVNNPNVIFREIVDNFTDEAYACEYCNKGFIHNDFNGYHVVFDNGRGIPITYGADPTKTQAEQAIATLNAGSKFEVSGVARSGQNGVGSVATNALSSRYILLSRITKDNFDKSIPEVKRLWESKGPRSKKDLYYMLEYSKGVKIIESAGTLEEIQTYIFKGIKNPRPIPTGYSTLVLFIPDDTMFENTKAQAPMKNLRNFMLIQKKFYNKDVEVIVNDKSITDEFTPYKYELNKVIIPADTSKNKIVQMYATFEVDPNLGSRETEGSINSLVVNQGHHIQIFEACYRESLVKRYGVSHNYIFNGLKVFVIVLCEEVVFSSQTKEICKSIVKVKSSDFEDVTKELIKIFKTDEDYWQAHVNRLNAYAESMTNISTIDKIKKDLMGSMTSNAAREKMNLPEKLSDATAGRSERLKCELFLCEGASAAGSLKSGRKNSMYHGVYALRGRTLNTINKTVDQMMESKELNGIFKSIGLGLDAINVTHEEELKLGRPLTFEERSNVIKKYARYGKICIACDADEDGLAITSSLLSTFAKFARFLLDAGMIYISESPYYIQNGKYFYPSDVQADGSVPGLDFSKEFHRIKGLGQLNKNQVYESFFDETKRKLIQVTPQNLDRAIELIADINVRKQFLRDSNILTNPFNLN